MITILKQCGKLLIVVVSLVFAGIVHAEDIRIALRAHNGAQKALEQWQATADYLTDKIPGYRFILVPFENNSVQNEAVSRGEFHFCLTNPASAVEHKIRYGAQPMATLVNKRQGKGYTRFGTVIFTRADRNDINKLSDLKGKTFIGSDELGFGGWRVAWREFLKNNINPYTDFKEIHFAGGKQQKVVYAVRDGKADAGSVRTDMLERLAASGIINMDDFKVIANKATEGFPFLHSTELYPEWLFSAVREMDDILKTQVVAALFSIPADGLAAKNGKYIGWISPMDYTSVENLLKELRVGPYHVATMSSFERLVSQYGQILFTAIIIIILLTLTILYMVRLNRHVTVARDSLRNEVSTRKMLERQLLHIQKMESLGQLTGGVAHDFNNMLAIILGFTELSINSDAVSKDSKLTGYLDQVITTVEKAKMLVNQMLAFSRTEGDVEKAEVLMLADVLEEVYQLLRPLLPSSIDLRIKNNDRNLYINVSKVMINQVLMNLCLNAKDAITGSHGIIKINTEIAEFECAQCDSCHQDVAGYYTVIQIEDDGCGIDAISKVRLFEPFFSTKEIHKGTGMGLSMVHGIIHQHGGHILLDSEVDKGTVIKILLPPVSKTKDISNLNKYSPIQIVAAENANKHILIVDDEVSITIYLSELLQLHGYKVTALNNSQDAFSYFEKHYDEIDLVLTDQTMPNITGIDMAAKMLAISKDIPVVLCTGFSEHIDDKTALGKNIRAYMEKPIQSDKLINTISSLLSQVL